MEITTISGGVSVTLTGERGVLELVMLLSLTGVRMDELTQHDLVVCDNNTHVQCWRDILPAEVIAEAWRTGGEDGLAAAMRARYDEWVQQPPRSPLDHPDRIAHLERQLDEA